MRRHAYAQAIAVSGSVTSSPMPQSIAPRMLMPTAANHSSSRSPKLLRTTSNEREMPSKALLFSSRIA